VTGLKYGRKPADHSRPHVRLARLLPPTIPAPPESCDWISDVPADAWGMLGNDKVGDCTCAGVGHKRIGDVWANQGIVLVITEEDAIKFYENFGYDPRDPNTDQGAMCQDVLEFWQKHGFNGEKILAFAKVNVRDEKEVKTAINLFGQIYTGFDVPDTAEEQFNNGEAWDVVPGSESVGGHCVTLGAYDKNGYVSVTWGRLQKLTSRFFRKYWDEAWVIFGPDFFKDNVDRQGISRAQLEHYFTLVTGRPLG